MCGIAGILRLSDAAEPPARDELASMLGAIRHRGPDEFGIYRDAHIGLAHARLSIIDVASGTQPISNEDGSLWAIFNGEVFNYIELRAELEGLGHRFSTRSDTEVVVHAFEAWGESAFERFNGQWAVAFWNARSRTLVLARDPLGVRPIYTCEHRGRLYFASEVKAIFAADSAVSRAFDPSGLRQVFTFWSSLAPRTVFAGVNELEPGCVLTHSGRDTSVRQYWTPRYPCGDERAFRGSLDDAACAVRDALERATRLRALRADVPVGSYLSGGLDSSLVAALGHAAMARRLRTFSVRFEDAEYDETPFQRLVARRLGSEHCEVVVSRADIAQAFPEVVFSAERPLLRAAPAPLFLLSRLVHEAGIKVVLTGEGADEMFAGYDLFREAKIRRFWARQPDSACRPRLLERLYPYLARSPVGFGAMTRTFFGQRLAGWQSPGFGHGPRWRSTSALQRLLTPAVREAAREHDPVGELMAALPREFGSWSSLAQDQYLELRTLLAGYILSSQGDRMMMANSVEGRFPFLDRDVVALADSLPPPYKLRALDEKHVLKRVARALVPPEIIERKNQPYRAPDAVCFVGKSAPGWVDELISTDALKEAGVLDPVASRLAWTKIAALPPETPPSNTDNMALVGIVSIQLLFDNFIRRRRQTEPVTAWKRIIEPGLAAGGRASAATT